MTHAITSYFEEVKNARRTVNALGGDGMDRQTAADLEAIDAIFEAMEARIIAEARRDMMHEAAE